MGKFAQQVKAFVEVAQADMRTVAADSIQEVVELAQSPQTGISKGATSFVEGKIPVAEGDLVSSLVSGVNGAEGAAGYSVAIAGFELGDTLRFAWTQEYAMRIEHGFIGTDSLGRTYNQPGRHFVGANAAKFPRIVAEHVKKVRG